MKMDSPLVDRFSYLLEPGSLLAVNIARVIQQAGNPVRKICTTPAGVAEWPAGPSREGTAQPREKERLSQFLAG